MNVQAVAQLQKYLRQSEEWDNESAALVFSEHNRLYLTGFPATDGAMLVTADDAALFYGLSLCGGSSPCGNGVPGD